MPHISDWIAELTEEKRQAEEAAKEAAKPFLRRIEAIDANIAHLYDLASILGITLESKVLMPPTGAIGLAGEAPSAQVSERKPIRKWAADVYRRIGRPMRIPTLRREIAKAGGPEVERETLRTIVRTSEEFESLGDGYYGLIEWPVETKRIRVEG